MVQLYDLSNIKLSTFGQVRAKGLRSQWLNLLQGRPNELLPFRDVQHNLRLYNKIYNGLQTIRLDQIIGSVGRVQDFSREFYPRHRALEGRWENVNRLFLGTGLYPIEVYKVSNIYFVLDGHHRVSVCRNYEVKFIEAYVTEFYSPIPLNKNDNFKTIHSKLRKSKTHLFLD